MNKRVARIAELNDLARTAMGICSRVVMTAGVAALPGAQQSRIREAIETFNDFKKSNDPFGEHDFGQVIVDGERVLWKIDYYDRTLQYGSEDPADPKVTTRVLTIMLPGEY